jgi:hypothetical protein
MISGGVKFFEPCQNLGVDGAVINASSGDSSATYAIDRNPDTTWRSSGSLDVTTETLTITFPETTTIDRLFLLRHNWKEFSVQYYNGSTWVNFANVTGIDGAKASISETTFSDSCAYYEFDEVSTTQLRIQVTKTQVANEEKYVSQIIATRELGTLVGYPQIKGVDVDRNARVKKSISGRYIIQKSDETFGATLDFKEYPSSDVFNVDVELMMDLHDREEPFLVWLCGGRRGSTYFRYTLRGFRLDDVLLMQISKAFKLSYASNIYTNPVNCKVELEEHI